MSQLVFFLTKVRIRDRVTVWIRVWVGFRVTGLGLGLQVFFFSGKHFDL